MYKYSYRVVNESNSVGTLERFAIRPVLSQPVQTAAPDHWMGELGFVVSDPQAFVWYIADPGPAPPGWVDAGNNTYASVFGADPGDTLTGFGLSLPTPPGQVEYTVHAWTDEPSAPEGMASEGPDELSFFDDGTTGIILGPGGADGPE
jgi:hypothetical protein